MFEHTNMCNLSKCYRSYIRLQDTTIHVSTYNGTENKVVLIFKYYKNIPVETPKLFNKFHNKILEL